MRKFSGIWWEVKSITIKSMEKNKYSNAHPNQVTMLGSHNGLKNKKASFEGRRNVSLGFLVLRKLQSP